MRYTAASKHAVGSWLCFARCCGGFCPIKLRSAKTTAQTRPLHNEGSAAGRASPPRGGKTPLHAQTEQPVRDITDVPAVKDDAVPGAQMQRFRRSGQGCGRALLAICSNHAQCTVAETHVVQRDPHTAIRDSVVQACLLHSVAIPMPRKCSRRLWLLHYVLLVEEDGVLLEMAPNKRK